MRSAVDLAKGRARPIRLLTEGLVAAAWCMAFLVACGSGGGSLEIPDPAAVARLQATGEGDSSAFSNREGISHVVGVLEGLGDGWQSTTEPLGPMLYSASLSAEDNTILFVVWVGEDWVAANDMQKKPNFRRRLVDLDREKLLRSMGVGPYFDAVD